MTTTATPYGPVPMDRLVGMQVIDRDGRAAGRIHEFRVDVRGTDWVITDYVIGVAGLLERLGIGVKLLLGTNIERKVAAADQLIFDADLRHARLTCRADELRSA